MKIKTLQVTGWIGTLEALRKPFKGKMKSDYRHTELFESNCISTCSAIYLHEEDIKLMSKLVKAGDEHAKVIRGIMVYFDLTLSRGIWQEMDTYRIGRETLCSESTMHTLLKDDLSINDFESDEYSEKYIEYFIKLVDEIKTSGYSAGEKRIAIKNRLPESFLQTRTLVMSYQALRRIYFQRRNHSLPVWKVICKYIETLPYSKELITIEK